MSRLRELQKLRIDPELTVLVIVLNHWGRGKTIPEALRQCQLSGGKYLDRCPMKIFVSSDPTIHVDQLGNVVWSSDHAKPVEIYKSI